MKTIEIIVAPDGKATVATKGFVGSSCRDATRLLEAALGEITAEWLAAEFHQVQASQQQKNSQR